MVEDTFDKYIMEFKNACPDNLCDEIINWFESNDCKKKPGMTTGSDGGIVNKLKRTTDAHFDMNIPYQYKIGCIIIYILTNGKFKYIETCKTKNLDKEISTPNPCMFPIDIIQSYLINCIESSPRIQKYGEGDYFNWHTDYAVTQRRFLAYILYLNDVDSDSGGETVFISGKRIRPEKGKLLVFPASLNYIHKGETIKKGSKYIITSFSMLPDVPNFSLE
jgi:hypothetical protein